jgi:hypothetical protein
LLILLTGKHPFLHNPPGKAFPLADLGHEEFLRGKDFVLKLKLHVEKNKRGRKFYASFSSWMRSKEGKKKHFLSYQNTLDLTITQNDFPKS